MARNHPHGGHRARLRRRQETEGLGAFEPHEVLELLLYTVIPQRDVNPLAHALIDRFGSVSGVLCADPDEIALVPGMGRHSALWLTFLREITGRYTQMRLSDRPKITNVKLLSDHCARLFEPMDNEQVWLMCMNMAGHLLGSTQLSSGDWRKKLTLREAVEPALRYQAQSALLLQRRRPGNLVARDEDVEFTNRLATQLQRVRIRLLDSVIMAGHSVISMRHSGMYRVEGERMEGELNKLCEHWLDEMP